MIYWITRDKSGNYLSRANNDGTGVQAHWLTKAFLEAEASISGFGLIYIAVTAEHIYYSFGDSDGLGNFYFGRCKIDGTEPEPKRYKIEMPSSSLIEQLTVQGEYVYFRVTEESKSFIGRIKLDGTGAEPEWVEVEGYGSRLVSNATHLYFDSFAEYIGRVKLDGTGLVNKWIERPREEADEAYFLSISVTETNFYFLHTLWYNEKEETRRRLGESDLTGSPTVTIVDKYEGAGVPKGFPEQIGVGAGHIFTGYILGEEGGGTHHGIGRYTGSTLTPEFIALGEEAETLDPVITEVEGEPEPEGHIVKVKQGGSLVSAQRYVKAGGKLVSA